MKNKKFNRIYRLGKETSKVIEKGKRIKLDNMIMYYLSSKIPKVSIVISRKVAGSVGRNKLKRWTRELFRIEKENLNNYAMAVIYKLGSKDYEYNDVVEKLNILWDKAGIKK